MLPFAAALRAPVTTAARTRTLVTVVAWVSRSAANQGARLMRDDDVVAEIARGLEERKERVKVETDRVEEETERLLVPEARCRDVAHLKHGPQLHAGDPTTQKPVSG